MAVCALLFPSLIKISQRFHLRELGRGGVFNDLLRSLHSYGSKILSLKGRFQSERPTMTQNALRFALGKSEVSLTRNFQKTSKICYHRLFSLQSDPAHIL